MLFIWQVTESRGDVSSNGESAAMRFPEFGLDVKQQMIRPIKDIFCKRGTKLVLKLYFILNYFYKIMIVVYRKDKPQF